MNTLFTKIKNLALLEGQVALAWLGQSGYLLKIYPETFLIIDPYLSDYCEQQLGIQFKRLMPAPISVEEIDHLDLFAYLITHHHEDHYDPLFIREMKNKKVTFYTTPTTVQALLELGIDKDRCLPLAQDSSYELDHIRIHGTFADHGKLAPDAVGIVLKLHNKVIYHMGDTCLNEEQCVKLREKFEIDLLIVPINGMFGNMDDADAVQAVRILQPKTVTPSHFWMLPGNSGGSVVYFIEQVNSVAANSEILLFQCGEIVVL